MTERKLIGGRVRACGHRWAGLGQDAGPWQGTGSGPVGGNTIDSAPRQPADGGGSSPGLEMALHPSTKSSGGSQPQPLHPARGIPTLTAWWQRAWYKPP